MDDQRTDRTSGGMNEGSQRFRFQFSLKTLLIVMTVIALCALAYVTGYRNGRAKTLREILLEEMRTTSSQREFPAMQAVDAELGRFVQPKNNSNPTR
jgi:hypothetical protein